MKKFLAVLVVLAITGMSSMAFAAEVTVGGSLEVRSRNFDNLNVLTSDTVGMTSAAMGDQTDTQNRIRIDINAKTDNVKAKLQLNNDFDSWGQAGNSATPAPSLENYSSGGRTMGYREAWMNFNLPGIPVNVNVGHQLLQLGHGYFFRSQHFGSDAWVLANVTGPNTVAFVNVKAFEGATSANDDVDAYVLLDVFKINDKMNVGIDLTRVHDRRAAALNVAGIPAKDADLNNLSVNFTGAFGPMNLKAQIDMQSGKIASDGTINPATGLPFADSKFKGNEIIVKGDVAAGPATVNFLVARGSGQSATDTDVKQYVNLLDIDPHVAFLYEYKIATAAGRKNTGFANTTALNVGAGMDVAKSLNLAANFWLLKATKGVALNGATDVLGNPATSKDAGMEIDVKATWKLYDNLTWTWDLGYFMPGAAYDNGTGVAGVNKSADEATGIQGILAFKF